MITFERFESAKLKRFVNRYGKPYTFKRAVLNEYKEPTDALSKVCDVVCVYHESSYKHLSETIANAGRYVVEITPMMLCLRSDASDLISVGDTVEVNGKTMEVLKLKDVNNSGFAYDISLRWIDDDSHA